MLAQLDDYRASSRAGASVASDAADGTVAARLQAMDDLLLIEASKSSRTLLQRTLAAQGFPVTSVANAQHAYVETERKEFSFAVVGLGARERDGFDIVTQLRRRLARLRIVVITDADSFASVVMALRAGADNYLAKTADPAELIDALLDRSPELPPIPSMPLGLSRVCWEHIMRVHEQCGRNVSLTAQRLSMHRRSLQRILGKRAPQPRAAPTARAATDVPGSRFRRQHAGSRMRQL
jgi:two-component system, response regulator RegA